MRNYYCKLIGQLLLNLETKMRDSQIQNYKSILSVKADILLTPIYKYAI